MKGSRGPGVKDSSELLKNYNELSEDPLFPYHRTFAEGYGRKTTLEYVSFLYIAYGSVCELEA